MSFGGPIETLDLSAVVSWTSSGATAFRVARERPSVPVVSISPNLATGRKLALVWGVHAVVAEDARDQDDMVERACRTAFSEGFARAGERIIIEGLQKVRPGVAVQAEEAGAAPAAPAAAAQ